MINPRCERYNTPNNCSIPSSSMQRQKQLLSNQPYLLSGSEGTVANQMRHNHNAPMPIFPPLINRNENAFASMQLATAPLPVTGNLSSLSTNNVFNPSPASFENRNPQQSIFSMQPLPVNILGFNKFQHVPKSCRNVPESSNSCNVYSEVQFCRSQMNAGSSREMPMRVSSDNASNGSCLSNSADMISDKSYKRCQFPHKLYEMLMKAECMGYSDVVSFLPHGRAFIVRDKGLFEERVLPMFFSHKSFNSFRRQINLYDFIRLRREECSIAYYHKSFLRGRSDLLDNITPRAQKGNKKLDLNMIGLNGDPDFYRMGAISPLPK